MARRALGKEDPLPEAVSTEILLFGVAMIAGGETTFAGQVLSLIGLFRLNAKHRDVQFQSGSCWEARFGGWKQVR
jgi:hypothetical protein